MYSWQNFSPILWAVSKTEDIDDSKEGKNPWYAIVKQIIKKLSLISWLTLLRMMFSSSIHIYL
jgi:hypothetical protein